MNPFLKQSSNPPISPPQSSCSPKPLKFGILGAARIAPLALIVPARSHPEVEVYAVAGRTKDEAEVFAKKHGIEKAYGSYNELIKDPEVEIVYIPVSSSFQIAAVNFFLFFE